MVISRIQTSARASLYDGPQTPIKQTCDSSNRSIIRSHLFLNYLWLYADEMHVTSGVCEACVSDIYGKLDLNRGIITVKFLS